jgi:5-formyltetrahydrofolate cyclo-ligase
MPKERLRESIRKKLNLQSKEERLRKSLKIAKRLFALKEFKRAKVVMFYIAKDGEVETRQMISEAKALGKRIVVPHINRKTKKMLACQLKDMDKELCKGPYGLQQPKENCKRPLKLKSIDLVVVPGIAFSQDGQRLGRGGGYYDRFLKRLPKKSLKVGLAFNFQIVKNLPSLSHDVPVDIVLSA